MSVTIKMVLNDWMQKVYQCHVIVAGVDHHHPKVKRGESSWGEWAWNKRLWGQECFRFACSHLALEVERQTIIVKWRNRRWGNEQDGQMWKNCIAVADGHFNVIVPLHPEQRPTLLEFISYCYGGHSSIFSTLYWQNGTVCWTLAQPIIHMRRYNVCIQCRTQPSVCSMPVM
jgi:hypothetical protein